MVLLFSLLDSVVLPAVQKMSKGETKKSGVGVGRQKELSELITELLG